MTWLDSVRHSLRAPRTARPTRPNRFRPGLEELQRRDVPSTLSGLSGFVYVDANNNGAFDSGESPISGVVVTLTGTDTFGAVNKPTTTDANGMYSFKDLLPGKYTITEKQPAGYLDGKDTQGTPGTGTTGNDVFRDIVLAPSVYGINNNFGERPCTPPAKTGSLSGMVYLDCNNNGKFDPGETGIKGVTITLTGPGGTRTMTTDASGRYAFSDLIAGTYKLTESQPTGYGQGKNAAGTPTNGTVNGDVITNVVVGGTGLTGYYFGETKYCGCDTGKGSNGKGSHGKGSNGKGSGGKGSHAVCDNGSHGKGSHGKGSGGKGSHAVCGNGSHTKGSSGKGSNGKGSSGKGSHAVCDKGSRGKGSNGKGSGGKGSNGKGSHSVCNNGSHGKGSSGKGSGGKGSNGKGSGGKGSHAVCDNGHGKGSHSLGDKGSSGKGSHNVCGKPVKAHC